MLTRVYRSQNFDALSFSSSIWSRPQHASFDPPRIGVPSQTHRLPHVLRAQTKTSSSDTVKAHDAQGERVMRLIEATRPYFRQLDMEGWVRLGARDAKQLPRWIIAPSKLEPTRPAPILLTNSSHTRRTNLNSFVLFVRSPLLNCYPHVPWCQSESGDACAGRVSRWDR